MQVGLTLDLGILEGEVASVRPHTAPKPLSTPKQSPSPTRLMCNTNAGAPMHLWHSLEAT